MKIYEPAPGHDGIRILVDRFWPRGVKKEDARLDYWLKDATPDNELENGSAIGRNGFRGSASAISKSCVMMR